MSLNFCCNIQIVGKEFYETKMKAWIHVTAGQGDGDCCGFGGYFLSTCWDIVSAEPSLNTTAHLCDTANHVHFSVLIFWGPLSG